LTLLHVKDQICDVALDENFPILSIIRHAPPAVHGV